jgi:hypothetical protein
MYFRLSFTLQYFQNSPSETKNKNSDTFSLPKHMKTSKTNAFPHDFRFIIKKKNGSAMAEITLL